MINNIKEKGVVLMESKNIEVKNNNTVKSNENRFSSKALLDMFIIDSLNKQESKKKNHV